MCPRMASGGIWRQGIGRSAIVLIMEISYGKTGGAIAALFSECARIWFSLAIFRLFLRQGRAGQTEFLSDTTSEACLADGHQPQGPTPFFPLSITHIFSGALPLVNLSQFCDLANPHQDSFGNGAHDLTQYCLGPSSGFGG